MNLERSAYCSVSSLGLIEAYIIWSGYTMCNPTIVHILPQEEDDDGFQLELAPVARYPPPLDPSAARVSSFFRDVNTSQSSVGSASHSYVPSLQEPHIQARSSPSRAPSSSTQTAALLITQPALYSSRGRGSHGEWHCVCRFQRNLHATYRSEHLHDTTNVIHIYLCQ